MPAPGKIFEDSGAPLDDASNPEPRLLGSESGFLDLRRDVVPLRGPEIFDEHSSCNEIPWMLSPKSLKSPFLMSLSVSLNWEKKRPRKLI